MGQAHLTEPASEQGYLSQPTGYLLSKAGLFILLGLLLLAAWFRQVAVVILLGLVLSAASVARLWSRLSLVGVSCQRFLSEPRVFPGEQIELKLRLSNRKLLPLPWVQVDDEIPEPLVPEGAAPATAKRPGCRSLSNTASLLWYTSVSWRYHLLCRKRGYYKVGPLTVSSGDIFGFYPRSTTQATVDYVIVYPKLYPIAHLDVPSLHPMGETQAERRIFEDPTRTIGVRDYSPGDSLRHVHWKASARHQNLQVKIFEPTTTLKVALFLAVDSFQSEGVNREDDFELGISAAASLANYLVERRNPVGLFVNTSLVDAGQPVSILPASGSSQIVNILEMLAKVILTANCPFEEFLQREWSRLPWGTTLVLIISRPPSALPGLLAGIKEAGYKTVVIQIGEQTGDKTEKPRLEHLHGEPATAWYQVSRPEDLHWLRSDK